MSITIQIIDSSILDEMKKPLCSFTQKSAKECLDKENIYYVDTTTDVNSAEVLLYITKTKDFHKNYFVICRNSVDTKAKKYLVVYFASNSPNSYVICNDFRNDSKQHAIEEAFFRQTQR